MFFDARFRARNLLGLAHHSNYRICNFLRIALPTGN